MFTRSNLVIEGALSFRAKGLVWWVRGAFEGWAGGSGERRPGRAAGGPCEALVAICGAISGSWFLGRTRRVRASPQAPSLRSDRAGISGGFDGRHHREVETYRDVETYSVQASAGLCSRLQGRSCK